MERLMDRGYARAPEGATKDAGTAPRGSRVRLGWLVAGVAVLGLLAAACGGSSSADNGAIIQTTTPTPLPTATAGPNTPTSTPTETETPDPTETAEPTPEVPVNVEISDLPTFVSNYGYPTTATFATLRIPRFGVEAQVSAKHVGNGAASMPNPNGPAEVAWYDLSAWEGLGGTPGGGQNAIFSGHRDYAAHVGYAGVDFRGLGVFARLGDVDLGDLIEVEFQGQTLRYQVVDVTQVAANTTTNWGDIWSSDTGGIDTITLYTCGGEFVPSERSYVDRVVVRAERVG
jgi:LPXTG-site transpeptidase (sortase) family protein